MEDQNIGEAVILTVGIILAFVGYIPILINAFKQNVWWGIVSLVLPIYAFMYWDKNKQWFGIWFSGFLCYMGALIYFAEEGMFTLHPFAF
jgi:hypothetical protein